MPDIREGLTNDDGTPNAAASPIDTEAGFNEYLKSQVGAGLAAPKEDAERSGLAYGSCRGRIQRRSPGRRHHGQDPSRGWSGARRVGPAGTARGQGEGAGARG
jgi:hypothetical protein